MSKYIYTVISVLLLSACSSSAMVDLRNESIDVNETNSPSALNTAGTWIHGASDCAENADPAIQVLQVNQSSYILRQNKCAHFEAPFMYLLLGENKALLLDTGAGEDPIKFPVKSVIQSLIKERELLVIHSHRHSDHYAGDGQFTEQPNVRVIAANSAAMSAFFKFDKQGLSTVELGKRTLTVLKTPGHQDEAITVYDPLNKWLLTGDTFYPGLVYVKDWQQYTQTISTLAKFSKRHQVNNILGTHIEMMNKPGEFYPIGSTYQPNERPLTLFPAHLQALDVELQKSDEPREIVFNDFVIMPMNAIQKALTNVVGALRN